MIQILLTIRVRTVAEAAHSNKSPNKTSRCSAINRRANRTRWHLFRFPLILSRALSSSPSRDSVPMEMIFTVLNQLNDGTKRRFRSVLVNWFRQKFNLNLARDGFLIWICIWKGKIMNVHSFNLTIGIRGIRFNWIVRILKISARLS